MPKELFLKVLKDSLNSMGFAPEFLSADKAEKIYIHAAELSEKGKLFNLTAITDPEEVAKKHFADCLFAASKIEKLSGGEKKKLLDVGSGAGFPSLPIAVVCENISVYALDSTAKKCAFTENTAKISGVNILTLPCRAEDAVKKNGMRGSFDFVTARAVARLNVLMELCAPFLSLGGHFVSMKGSCADEELDEAKNAAAKLGLSFSEKEDYDVGDGINRSILVYEKVKDTPLVYPRQYSKIKKSPLR